MLNSLDMLDLLDVQETFAGFKVLHFSSLQKHWAGNKIELQHLTEGLFHDWCCSAGNHRFELTI